MNETFSIEFKGPAIDAERASVHALSQSLSSLEGLIKKATSLIYGSGFVVKVRIAAGSQNGSFLVDIDRDVSESQRTAKFSFFPFIGGLFSLCKWAYGKELKVLEDGKDSEAVKIQNAIGCSSLFNRYVVTVYNNKRIKTQLSRLTQTLDSDGVDSICIFQDKAGQREEFKIDKEDRKYYCCEEGVVLTDNECEVILYVLASAINGSTFGWRFSEGEGGFEFNATVEDEDFLEGVKNRKITLVNGTTIRAVVRTVQRKNVRTITDRTVVEVKDVFDPAE